MSSDINANIWFAGAFAAVGVNVLVYPLDTLKTRIQSPGYARLYRSAATGAARPSLYRGLYQGFSSILIVSIPSSGAFFTTYETLKRSLRSIYSLPQPAIHALSSTGAELVNCAITTPAEVVRQNAQVFVRDTASNTSTSAMKDVLKHYRHHPTKLWSGYTALAARNIPFTALQFPILEHLRSSLLSYRVKSLGKDKSKPSDLSLYDRAAITAISAGIGGSIAAYVTTPIDVVKTRMMLGSREPTIDRKHNPLTMAKEILSKEGMKGLFRGGALRFVFTAVGNGLYMGCYEGSRLWLEERKVKREERGGLRGEGLLQQAL